MEPPIPCKRWSLSETAAMFSLPQSINIQQPSSITKNCVTILRSAHSGTREEITDAQDGVAADLSFASSSVHSPVILLCSLFLHCLESHQDIKVSPSMSSHPNSYKTALTLYGGKSLNAVIHHLWGTDAFKSPMNCYKPCPLGENTNCTHWILNTNSGGLGPLPQNPLSKGFKESMV